jgi:hypothetical protein
MSTVSLNVKEIRFMHILLPQVRHNLILLGSQNLEYLIKLSFQCKTKKENVCQCRNKIFRICHLVFVFITNAYFKHLNKKFIQGLL